MLIHSQYGLPHYSLVTMLKILCLFAVSNPNTQIVICILNGRMGQKSPESQGLHSKPPSTKTVCSFGHADL